MGHGRSYYRPAVNLDKLWSLVFLDVELNRETDELRVLLHQILKSTLLQEFGLVLFQIADDLGAALHFTMDHLCVFLDSKGAACCRLPDILLIIVVLADHADLVGNEVS